MSEMDKYYQILGLNPGASEEEIRKTYKILIKVWDPDRFLNDSKTQSIAYEKIKEIDEAFKQLVLAAQSEQPFKKEKPSTSASEPYGTPSLKTVDEFHVDYSPTIPHPSQTITTIEEMQNPEINELQIRPWVRYWARMMDFLLFGVLSGLVLGIIYPPALEINNILLGIILLFVYVFVEPIMLTSWGATPGKALLRVRLRKSNGKKPTYLEALGRSVSVWVGGWGLGIPIVSLATLIIAYRKLKKDGITTWDGGRDFNVSHRQIGAIRVIITVLIFISFVFLITLDKSNAILPRSRISTVPSASSFLSERKDSTQPLPKMDSTQPLPKMELSALDWYNKGEAFRSSGHYKEAIDAYRNAIELNPSDAKSYAMRAVANSYIGNHQQVIYDLNKVLELNPSKEWETFAYEGRGLASVKLGIYQQAIRDFDKAIQLNPKEDKLYYNRGYAYMMLQGNTNAIKDFDKALELNPNNGLARDYRSRVHKQILEMQSSQHLSSGDEYLAKGQYDKAIEQYTEGINKYQGIKFGEISFCYSSRGIAYSKIGQYDRAIGDFTQAISLFDHTISRDKWKVYLNRGSSYDNKGEFVKAIQDYDKAIELNPKYARSYNNRALAYLHNGQPDKAIEDLDYAIWIDPTLTSAYFNRGLIYNKKGDLEKAKRDFQISCDRGDNDGCKELKNMLENTTVIIDCPKCSQKLRVQRSKHGHVTCPKCNHQFEI